MMDTSSGFSSPTFDFLSGEGTNLPRPTGEEYARRIFVIGEKLRETGVLGLVIGNKPFERLPLAGRILDSLSSADKDIVRGGRVVQYMSRFRSGDLSRNDSGTECLYLGYNRSSVFWLHAVFKKNGEDSPICEVLDIEGMSRLLAKYDYRGYPLSLGILHWLIAELQAELKQRQEMILKLDEQLVRLKIDEELLSSVIREPIVTGGMIL